MVVKGGDPMKDLLIDHFQETVNDLLIRHKSILDVLSKLNEASARVHRATVKAVTQCGCLKIDAKKPTIPEDATILQLKEIFDTHLKGELCPNCKDTIEKEMGRLLFYLTALCNHLDINLYDVFIKEQKALDTLNIFNFT